MKCFWGIFLIIFNLLAEEGFQGFSDTETENLIKDMISIIYKHSNMPNENIKVLFLIDNNINAFVNENNNVFVFSGLLLNLENALEVFSILCHEAGHVACGHTVRLQNRMNQLSSIGMAMVPIFILAGIANPGAAIGAMLATGNILMHQLCLYTINEEKSADTFAIKTLASLNYPLSGFISSFKKLMEYERVVDIKNMSFKTHPDLIERIRNCNDMINIYYRDKKTKQFPKTFQERFERVFYKLSGFLRSRHIFYKHLLPSKKYMQYGEAVLLHKEGLSSKAIQVLDKLLDKYPKDPYFLELKGQILYESGDFLNAAINYKKAMDRLPSASLIKIDFAKSLLKLVNETDLYKAKKLARSLGMNINSPLKVQFINLAEKTLKREETFNDDNLELITALLRCYRLKKDKAMSLFMLGKISYLEGNRNRALVELQEALNLLKKEKRSYIKVEDFILMIRNELNKSSN